MCSRIRRSARFTIASDSIPTISPMPPRVVLVQLPDAHLPDLTSAALTGAPPLLRGAELVGPGLVQVSATSLQICLAGARRSRSHLDLSQKRARTSRCL